MRGADHGYGAAPRQRLRANARPGGRHSGQGRKVIEAYCCRQAAAHDAVPAFKRADSILGSRLSHVTQSSDHSVNVSRAVMLSQLDAFGGLVVFTANFPRNLTPRS
jgi:hypothetical protein